MYTKNYYKFWAIKKTKKSDLITFDFIKILLTLYLFELFWAGWKPSKAGVPSANSDNSLPVFFAN